MRIRISHETRYTYETPAKRVIQTLRLTPRNHDGQYVARWRVEVSADCRLDRQEDAFGNITHTFSVDGAFETLAVTVTGEVETEDRNGIVRGTFERFPPSLFLRETDPTRPDAAVRAFAAEVAGSSADRLEVLHALLARLHADIAYAPDAEPAGTAAACLAARRGDGADMTHLFVAAARQLAIPARHVCGYVHLIDDRPRQNATHDWAEAFVPQLGWIGFDPVNGLCSTDAHIRVAVGLDHVGAAPVRGTHYGGGGETCDVAVRLEQPMVQVQA